MLGKMKIHELAKELGVTSKEILEKAKMLGVEVTSHLSNIDEEQANNIRKTYSKSTKNSDDNKVKEDVKDNTNNNESKNNKDNKKENKTVNKKDTKKDTPVIIRREVILNDDEELKKEDKKVEDRKDVGFVKRRNNNDYNIVYRNKPNKPLTVNELFGLGKKEEKPKRKVRGKQMKLDEIAVDQSVKENKDN